MLLAVALSMDAFAVSIGLGAKYHHRITWIAMLASVYFGVFQGVMPFLGYWGGRSVLGFIETLAPWVACVILLSLGGKMLYEAFDNDKLDTDDDDINQQKALFMTQKAMLSLAFATSIDAMAAGFTLNLMPVSPWVACVMIALVTGVLSFVGVFLGRQSGTWLERKAGILGGLVLIAIGLKMVIFS